MTMVSMASVAAAACGAAEHDHVLFLVPIVEFLFGPGVPQSGYGSRLLKGVMVLTADFV